MDKKLEINDLIGDAVNNALARRQGGMESEDGLLALSEEEARGIGGGLSIQQLEIKPIDPCVIEPYVKEPYVIAGYKPIPICPPIIVGLIAWEPNPKEPIEIAFSDQNIQFES